jgi:hypothetical protein
MEIVQQPDKTRMNTLAATNLVASAKENVWVIWLLQIPKRMPAI